MADTFIILSLDLLIGGEPLPANLYLFIDQRHIVFRGEGDTIDKITYDRLEFKKVSNLFVREADHAKYVAWIASKKAELPAAARTENAAFAAARADAHRKALDIFTVQHPDQQVAELIAASKSLVSEVMKMSLAVQSLAQLQTYSRGTVDHSVNVSILSSYLAMQMGYSHQLILQHVALGGLLHDIGKRKIAILEDDKPETAEVKMREHPNMGVRILESMSTSEKISNEVKMIVGQHHEYNDGTGYPKKLRGNAIYDLARIVSIANFYDELVMEESGPLAGRQKNALVKMDQVHYHKFDPDKFEKASKILKLGI